MSIQKVKYPRTYHLPYSLTLTDDDKRLSSDEHFKSAKTKKTIECWQIIGVDEIPSSPLKSRPEKFTIVSGDTKAEALENFRNDWCKGKSVAQMEVELAVIGEGT